MMQLKDIGFYTLSNHRAAQSNLSSPMWRCEMLVTDRCNFRCPYCQGFSSHMQKGDISIDDALFTLSLWIAGGLKNIRFSGGEPTVYPGLESLIRYCSFSNVERIAISTNGSRDIDLYEQLIDAGVDDFSISLDACCVTYGDKMAGVSGYWEKIVENIRQIAKWVYVTVGVVITDKTAGSLIDVIQFAHELGVADIRIISAAQYNQVLWGLDKIPQEILSAHPILNYRVRNYLDGRNVRGIEDRDSDRCGLVLDDSMVVGEYHYPCVIHAREGGRPIGKVSHGMREDRQKWSEEHNTHLDEICRTNCLDVCIDYNNTFHRMRDIADRRKELECLSY